MQAIRIKSISPLLLVNFSMIIVLLLILLSVHTGLAKVQRAFSILSGQLVLCHDGLTEDEEQDGQSSEIQVASL